ncbi:MAG: hypothetical protein JXB25_04180 [Deltaproteobacteria bacterium]|nr:hypothetical protein [Deltaproteobacteria bacterium]
MRSPSILTRIAVTTLFFGSLLALPGGALAATEPGFVSVRGDFFSCDLPQGWLRENPEPGSQRSGVHGLILTHPAAEGVPARLSVHHFGAGNPLYPSPEHFVERHSKPQLVLGAKDRYGPVTETVVAGRNAKTFERHHGEFVAGHRLSAEPPPKDDGRVYESRELMAKRVPVIERFVVVPGDSGFYVLGYSAPADYFQKFLNRFEHLTATFRPRR